VHPLKFNSNKGANQKIYHEECNSENRENGAIAHAKIVQVVTVVGAYDFFSALLSFRLISADFR
jgi:hypothetical protein